jgi:hypothetical protein
LGVSGEAEAEPGAALGEVFGGDVTAVGFDDAADESKPETEAAGVVLAGAFATVEGFKEVCEVVGGEAGTVVVDGDFDEGAPGGSVDADDAARLAVAGGVGQKVMEAVDESDAVAADTGRERVGDLDGGLGGGEFGL